MTDTNKLDLVRQIKAVLLRCFGNVYNTEYFAEYLAKEIASLSLSTREDAFEEAAKMCEALHEYDGVDLPSTERLGFSHQFARNQAREKCAAGIRALAATPKEPQA